ncbi:hypothetical protein CYLTODRAFT_105333 [Cylindrobasidium torrendii FP15055 ss-10]|uniref:Uncharacterized protein n=1 Tax=Cylindrobasidium torrendii FP15055 ss-10 TaxID=1314674 RepID=A0A0D7B2F6_9AGAR|nr:hypothetical protein CYLTODRAFT_105333 [Cylindrobasidium torrendii FP15055 ss-10]
MFFTRFAAAFTLGSAVFAAGSPSPSPRALDVGSEVANILEGLHNVTDTVLPAIAALVDITEATVFPLIQDLADALTTASDDLDNLTSTPTEGLVGRDGKEEVAQLLNIIISDVANTLNPILGDLQQIPAVSELLTTLGPVLNTALKALDFLIPGVVALVSGTLGPVLDILKNLGLGDVLGNLLGGL